MNELTEECEEKNFKFLKNGIFTDFDRKFNALMFSQNLFGLIKFD